MEKGDPDFPRLHGSRDPHHARTVADLVELAAPRARRLAAKRSLVAGAPHAIGVSLYRKLGYDILGDFAHVTLVATSAFVGAVAVDVGQVDGYFYIAMRHVPGISLDRLLQRDGRWRVYDVLMDGVSFSSGRGRS